jgi:hypothetical protein
VCVCELEAPGVGSVFSGGDDADAERETAKKKRKPRRELGECEEKSGEQKWRCSFGGEGKKVANQRFVR